MRQFLLRTITEGEGVQKSLHQINDEGSHYNLVLREIIL